MRREHDFLSQDPVKTHQQRAIEQLEPIVPENMEYPRPRSGGVSQKSGVVPRYPGHLIEEGDIRSQAAAEFQKPQVGSLVKFRAIDIRTADQLYICAFRGECRS